MDTGLHTLVALARLQQLPAEPDQIAHQFAEPGRSFTVTHILQAAKALTLKVKQLSLTLSDLNNATLPAIAQAKDGSFFVVARLSDQAPEPGKDKPQDTGDTPHSQGVLIDDLRGAAPRSVSLKELDQLWSGELIIVTRRQGLDESLQLTGQEIVRLKLTILLQESTAQPVMLYSKIPGKTAIRW